MKHRLDVINSYYVIRTEEKSYIIDTGSPESMGDDSSISLLGKTYKIQGWWSDLIPRAIEDHIGEKVDGLIGNDILKGHIVALDFVNRTAASIESAVISSDPATLSSDDIAIQLPLLFEEGVPVIDIEINHQKVRAILDTGASIPYANANILNGLVNVGFIHDISPIYGKIRTSSHMAEFRLGSLVGKVRIGKFTPKLSKASSSIGAEAIIGPSLLGECSSLIIDYIDMKIRFR